MQLLIAHSGLMAAEWAHDGMALGSPAPALSCTGNARIIQEATLLGRMIIGPFYGSMFVLFPYLFPSSSHVAIIMFFKDTGKCKLMLEKLCKAGFSGHGRYVISAFLSLYSSISSSARILSSLGVRAKNGHIVWHDGASFQKHCHQVSIYSIRKTLGAIIARIIFLFNSTCCYLSYNQEHSPSYASRLKTPMNGATRKAYRAGGFLRIPRIACIPGFAPPKILDISPNPML
jgi:hypothetical protein